MINLKVLTDLSSELPESVTFTFKIEKWRGKKIHENVPKPINFQEFSLRFDCTHGEGGGNANEAKANHCKSHGCSWSCNIVCEEYLVSWQVQRRHIPLHYHIATEPLINSGIFSASPRKRQCVGFWVNICVPFLSLNLSPLARVVQFPGFYPDCTSSLSELILPPCDVSSSPHLGSVSQYFGN